MIVLGDGDVSSAVLYVLSQREEDGWRIAEKYLAVSKEKVNAEELIEVFEWFERRTSLSRVVEINELYLALMIGPALQLRSWIEKGAVPLGFVLGRLTEIGLLMADTAARLEERSTKANLRKEVLRENARAAADARHARSRATGEWIKAWYRENADRFRSMDAAAEAVTFHKEASVSFRTARKYIGEAAKELRSARKA